MRRSRGARRDPRRVELISQSDSKDDRTDAEVLARVWRVHPKLLAPVEHREKQAQLDMELIEHGTCSFARARSSSTTCAARSSRSAGGCPSVPRRRSRRGRSGTSRGSSAFALAPLLDQIEHLTEEIRAFDGRIETATEKRYPQTELLRQVPGVGPITALGYVLTIADPTRFKTSRAVGSYLGLRPRKDESGDSSLDAQDHQGGAPSLPPTARPERPVHARSARQGYRPQAVGAQARGAWTQAREEGRRRRGGAQARGPAAPVVGHGRGVRASSQRDRRQTTRGRRSRTSDTGSGKGASAGTQGAQVTANRSDPRDPEPTAQEGTARRLPGGCRVPKSGGFETREHAGWV